ncbi:metal ABC transporter permease [Pelosinus fermentans]|jgi:zinc transport system permease protein|uniref:ABC-type transporter, integral membrane subunit n=1 Tax=Pelosinus fermentans JBW45 TaxID=1192197 RepID=I8U2T3_9FIRM|nr:metal ABC transporter permease [Pelosinus fermentans]AJQ27267.1 ABC-type transporter, integral membrane subunit [Pelosinus fermentans JBW45]
MEFFQYDFIQRALLAGLITGIVCPLIGSFVVVRRQSLIGDGLGHIAFAGVTGGYMVGLYPVVGALILTIAGAVGIELVRRRHTEFADMGLAIFFYAGAAMAIIFSTMTRMPSTGLLSFLFGSIITVSLTDVITIAGAGTLVLVIVYFLFDKLMLMSLDEDIANVAGINTGMINMLFSILTALVVVVGMTIVGILLVSALMIVPVATAHLLRVGFKATMGWAVIFSMLSVFIGLTSSFYLDIAPGGTIVMTAILLYIIMTIIRQCIAFKERRKEQILSSFGDE